MHRKISQTKIKSNLKRKSNPSIIALVANAKKHSAWLSIARLLSGPVRNYSSLNLSDIDENSKEGDTVLVPGKVLGTGDLTKKVVIVALSISSSAREKLKKTKSEFVKIIDEIKKNPKAEGVKVLR
jgi:large subunit ribosomal protein L18e